MSFLIVAAVLILCLNSAFQGETLNSVLKQNRVPTQSFNQNELNTKVSSGAVTTLGESILIAYPSVDEHGLLTSPLHVVKYEPANGKLIHNRLFAPQVSDECFGSVLSIQEDAGRVFIVSHINPSASCSLILDSHLRLQTTLMGWPLTKLSAGSALYEEDQIHFADVHRARLRLVDFVGHESQRVYPPIGDKERLRFSKDAAKYVTVPPQGCGEHTSCDPNRFDEDIVVGPQTNRSGSIFAFVASYDSHAFGEKADAELGVRYILYVYRKGSGHWSYCNREIANDEIDEVRGGLQFIFDQLVTSCSENRKVEVTPEDSAFANFEVWPSSSKSKHQILHR
jgi:hypothetical protein